MMMVGIRNFYDNITDVDADDDGDHPQVKLMLLKLWLDDHPFQLSALKSDSIRPLAKRSNHAAQGILGQRQQRDDSLISQTIVITIVGQWSQAEHFDSPQWLSKRAQEFLGENNFMRSF